MILFSHMTTDGVSGEQPVAGGDHLFLAQGSFGGGTVNLEYRMQDIPGFIAMSNTSFTAEDATVVTLAPGHVRAVLSGSSGADLNVGLARAEGSAEEIEQPLALVQGPDSALASSNMPSKPAKGATYSDPHYDTAGLTHRRVSDHAADTGEAYMTTTYSRRNPFNADSTRLLLESSNNMYIVDATTGAIIHGPFYTGPDSSRAYMRMENVWDYNNPDVMYALAADPLDSTPVMADLWRINRLDLTSVTGGVPARTTMIDLANVNFAAVTGHGADNSITDAFPGGVYMWTRFGEGMPSKVTVDSGHAFSGAPRYWAFLIMDGINVQADTSVIGAVTYDLQTNTITGVLKFSDIGMSGADHIDISASGDYVEIAFVNYCGIGSLGTLGSPCGCMVYTRDFQSAFGVHHSAPHGDFAIAKNGDEVFVYADFDDGYLRYLNCETGVRESLAEFGFPGGADVHISGNAFNAPGYVVWNQYDISEGSDASAQTPWLDKLMISEIIPDNGIQAPLATTWVVGHTYSRHANSDFSAPHPAANADLTRIAWGSNWDVSGIGVLGDIDTYVIEIDGALP